MSVFGEFVKKRNPLEQLQVSWQKPTDVVTFNGRKLGDVVADSDGMPDYPESFDEPVKPRPNWTRFLNSITSLNPREDAPVTPPSSWKDYLQRSAMNKHLPDANMEIAEPSDSPFATRPRIVPNEPIDDVSPIAAQPLRQSEVLQQRANEISNKDYSKAKKDSAGNILRDELGKVLHGKDYDSDHNWWDVLKGIGLGFAQGGLPGAIAGGIQSGFDRNADEKTIDQYKLQKLLPQIQAQQNIEQNAADYDLRQAQRQTILNDDERLRQQNAEMARYRREDLNRKIVKDAEDAENKRLDQHNRTANTIAGMLNRITSFDPDDPKNAALIKRMQEVGLPVFKKDAARDVKYVQDEKTGAWFVSTTDKTTGKSETSAVLGKDGNQLVTTPRVVVAGENAANVANINQRGATQRTQITQQGTNERFQTGLQNKNQQQKQQLAGAAFNRWQQDYLRANGALPSDEESAAARARINASIFGN